jgi:hypothetical protein
VVKQAVNTPIGFDFHPRGGSLVLKSSDPILGGNRTVSIVNYTMPNSDPSTSLKISTNVRYIFRI